MQYKTTNWNYPTTMWVGENRIQSLAKACEQLKISSPLFVTDEGLAHLDIVSDTLAILGKENINYSLFTNVQGNPTGANVDEGVTAYKTGKHDGVIAFGGGSALDVGKAIALMVGQTGQIWDYEDVGDNWLAVNAEVIPPIIAIPTTAGTGSEVGRASVITDVKTHQKKIIFHPKMLPSIVISDPTLCLGLPANITAWTGIDALVHAIEAYCAPGYHPMAEGIAIESIKLINKWLPIAYQEGKNIEARGQMLVAASMAATAFQKGLGSIHSVAHQLGAIYNTQHGLTNAILLPYGLKQNQSAIEDKMAHLCLILDLPIEGSMTDSFINHILELREAMDIPHTLAALNIDDSRAVEIGEMAFHDPSTPTNAKPVTANDLQQLFIAAVKGDFCCL